MVAVALTHALPWITVGVALCAVYLWAARKDWWGILIGAFLSFKVAYSAFLTAGQYLVWSGDPVLRTLADAPVLVDARVPHQLVPFLSLFNFPHGYATLYALDHFWLSLALDVLVSLLFFGVLWIVLRKKGAFLQSELCAAFLCSLLVGWPGVLVFVPLSLLVAVMVSAAQLMMRRASDVSLFLPLFFALIIMILWRAVGDPIVFFHLSALQV